MNFKNLIPALTLTLLTKSNISAVCANPDSTYLLYHIDIAKQHVEMMIY